MPTPTPSKAVLLNVGAFLADNNVRRNVGAFTYNFPSPTAAVDTRHASINPGEVLSWTSQMNPSAVTFLNCSSPLNVSLNLGDGTSMALVVNKVLVLDSDVRSLVIENTGTAVSKLFLLQA